MFYYYDPTYILILIGAIVALYAQIKVSTTYAKWQKVPSATRMTGAQIARQILDNNGCQDVRIEAINGKLTDHYDPENGVLRLSSEVYSSSSIAALGVAAHEAGHAIQDAQDYAPQHRLGRVDSAVHARPDPLVGAAGEDRHFLLCAGRSVLCGHAAGGV